MNFADTAPRFHSQPKQKQKIGLGLRDANSNPNNGKNEYLHYQWK
jgi:hypothetical protein